MKQALATTKCQAYQMSLIKENLPCLSPSLKKYLDDLVDNKDYSDLKLNNFFDEFGTHAILKATFGGKFV